ncbi:MULTISPECIES: hypothetical protein [unclassified Devosia]|uniref:hypothetical protein n=1 Tax=unclassified Devosia TaxID=196773 RepID=UPI00145D4D37|nr:MULTISPECIES: hypothetical protein [unclassified Devosia]MBJ6988759.1 hypothetical protein [Devosia sp. MC521]QMW63106.1 hypothetical protein H4N61_01740 [Devosia sp. MC521]
MIRNQRPLFLLIAGFTVWALAFIALYAIQALGCVYNWGGAHRAMLIAAYAISVLALTAMALLTPKLTDPSMPTLSQSAIWANWAALFSGVLVFLPVTFASTCV